MLHAGMPCTEHITGILVAAVRLTNAILQFVIRGPASAVHAQLMERCVVFALAHGGQVSKETLWLTRQNRSGEKKV
jgi:hypothetical protein